MFNLKPPRHISTLPYVTSMVMSSGDAQLLLVSAANAINATLYDKLNFNFIRDIAPISGIGRVSKSWW